MNEEFLVDPLTLVKGALILTSFEQFLCIYNPSSVYVEIQLPQRMITQFLELLTLFVPELSRSLGRCVSTHTCFFLRG